MASAPRAKPNQLPLRRVVWWRFLRLCFIIWFILCYRIRVRGRQHIPKTGPVLYLANHQSFLDPIIVGIASLHRPFFALGRQTLWDNKAMGWLIDSLNTIPVDQTKGDITAMRRAIDVMKQGHSLLVFPEGARTLDGKTAPFAKGTLLLIKRARPMVVPVAIEGAYDVWPRGQKRPRGFGRIGVECGRPIAAEQLLAMPPKDALKHLTTTVEQMRLNLAKQMGKHA